MSNNKIYKIIGNISFLLGRMMLALFSFVWVLYTINPDGAIYYASIAQKCAISFYIIIIGSYVIWDIYKFVKSCK